MQEVCEAAQTAVDGRRPPEAHGIGEPQAASIRGRCHRAVRAGLGAGVRRFSGRCGHDTRARPSRSAKKAPWQSRATPCISTGCRTRDATERSPSTLSPKARRSPKALNQIEREAGPGRGPRPDEGLDEGPDDDRPFPVARPERFRLQHSVRRVHRLLVRLAQPGPAVPPRLRAVQAPRRQPRLLRHAALRGQDGRADGQRRVRTRSASTSTTRPTRSTASTRSTPATRWD